MSLRRYEPWSVLNQLQNEMNRLFDPSRTFANGDVADIATSEWLPAVDIKEEPQRFLIRADIPGVKAEDLDVTMEHGVLTIKGERRAEKKEEKSGYHRVERAYGTFYRRFSLPDTADANLISAKLNEGVLDVEIPKQEKVQPRRINVQQ